MKGILLISHGNLAEGMLDTLSLFSGTLKQVSTLQLKPSEDITEYTGCLKKKINELDTGDGIIIFCDLLFGTPCNCVGRLLSEKNFADRINVVTGMNLPMLLEYVNARKDKVEIEKLIKIGKEGIVDFNNLYHLKVQSQH